MVQRRILQETDPQGQTSTPHPVARRTLPGYRNPRSVKPLPSTRLTAHIGFNEIAFVEAFPSAMHNILDISEYARALNARATSH